MKILWLDTETTGLTPGKHGIIQLAAIAEIDGKVVDEIELFMDPGNVVFDEEALRINKRTVEEIRSFEPSIAAKARFENFLSQYVDKYKKGKLYCDKFIPAGYNVKFDCDMMRPWIGKFYGSWFDYHVLDVMSVGFVERYCGRLELADHKLETLCRHYGVEIKAHNALDDIRATRELFRRIVKL